MTDFPDWTAPQANANAIATTGAPPLVLKQVVDVLIGQAINAGASVTRPASGQFPVNQPGYEIQLNVATLGATAPIVSVELQWYDSAFGGQIDDEIYYFYSGNLNGHLIHGRGPSKGDRVVVVITNHDATSQVTVSYTLLQTSRTFTREFWHTLIKAGAAPVFPGFTAVPHDIAANVLGAQSGSIAGSTTSTLVMPLYTGTCRLMGSGASTAGMTQWNIVTATDPVAGSSFSFQGVNGQTGFAPTGVTSLWIPEIALPRSQCQLRVQNILTVAQTVLTTLIAQEDRA